MERRYHICQIGFWLRLPGGHHGLVFPVRAFLADFHQRLEVAFCLLALEKALRLSRPEIFNTDQGSQFTSAAFVNRLKMSHIRISMDSRGRVFDNIFVERLWRTVKYEEVYLHDYQTVKQARDSLARYFRFYNAERLHSSLDYRTPQEVYLKEQPKPWQTPQSLHLKPLYFLS